MVNGEVMKQDGFTLIELMIVIAILGVLSSIAVSSYQNYVVRSQISEGINMAGSARIAVEETYYTSGELPDNNAPAGLPDSFSMTSTYVSRVDVENDGVIEINFGNSVSAQIHGGILVFTPVVSASGNLIWSCASSDIDNRFLPASCRT